MKTVYFRWSFCLTATWGCQFDFHRHSKLAGVGSRSNQWSEESSSEFEATCTLHMAWHDPVPCGTGLHTWSTDTWCQLPGQCCTKTHFSPELSGSGILCHPVLPKPHHLMPSSTKWVGYNTEGCPLLSTLSFLLTHYPLHLPLIPPTYQSKLSIL